MSWNITIEGSNGPIDIKIVRDQVGLNAGVFNRDNEQDPKNQLWAAEHKLIQAVASAAVVNAGTYADITKDASSEYMDALVATGMKSDDASRKGIEAVEKLQHVFGISERKVSKAWNVAEEVSASDAVLAISKRHSGGSVEARFNQRGNEVLLLFPDAHTTEQVNGIVAEVSKIFGGQENRFGKSLMGGNLVIRMPAQPYVDRLSGHVPGLQARRGG